LRWKFNVEETAMTGEPKVKQQRHSLPKAALKRRAAAPLSAELTAKLIHWLKVLHAEECSDLCRVVDGQARHGARCKRIQAVLAAAEGSR
jgi:hypothetical protein